jgi:hypothetical protein
MITLFSLFFVLFSQANTVHSDCPFIDLCTCDKHLNRIICNGSDGDGDDIHLPPLHDLPSVTDYYFSNFQEVQTNAFEKAIFLANRSITIYLMNISTIHPEAFSASMVIPDNSNLSIYIEHPTKTLGLTLATHAFNNIRIDHLYFVNIQNFNGMSVFNTHSFGANTYINELIFERSNLSGFNSVAGLEQPNIEHLYIRSCPSLTNLTILGLPAFLGTAKTFEISGTGLQYINRQVLQGWEYTIQELIIKDNHNLKQFPDMVSGFLDLLVKLDLSNNAITTLDSNYDWSPYYTLQHLILKQQLKLDLFIQTDILKSPEHIKIIDFSEGIISENDEDLIRNHVPGMPDLAAINISYTNFTANMVIDLLTIISNSADQIIQVSLLNHTLNDTNFCSYFQIFRQAPNLLRLELDETHECNCIVDLFYDDEHMPMILNDTLMQPSCLLNSSRARCDIQSQLSLSQCSVGKPNPGSDSGDIGTVAFIGTMVGLAIVLVVLLALGSRVVYRARLARSMTILDMENPVDNLEATTVDQPVENSLSEPAEVYFVNPSSDDMEEPLQTSF